MPTWVGHYEPLELFCLWTKVHQIFSLNVEGFVLDQVFFRCSICISVPEIFAIKVENPEILHFWPPFFWKGAAFLDLHSKIEQIPIMWQSLTAIGGGSSENEWLTEKHHG